MKKSRPLIKKRKTQQDRTPTMAHTKVYFGRRKTPEELVKDIEVECKRAGFEFVDDEEDQNKKKKWRHIPRNDQGEGVWLKVPSDWTRNPASCREIAELSAGFLRSQLGYMVCVHVYYGDFHEIVNADRLFSSRPHLSFVQWIS